MCAHAKPQARVQQLEEVQSQLAAAHEALADLGFQASAERALAAASKGQAAAAAEEAVQKLQVGRVIGRVGVHRRHT